MKRFITHILFSGLIVVFIISCSTTKTVYLKNGEVIRGKMGDSVNRKVNDANSVGIKLPSGKIISVKKSSISRIE